MEGAYYVDKTRFLKPLMESGNYVDLITRPRRFGKTLFLDTLRSFLSPVQSESDGVSPEVLFKGLDISRDEAFCNRFMGKTPVFFTSFKGIEGADFPQAYRALARKIASAAQSCAFLLQSERLSRADKASLEQYASLQFMRNLDNRDIAAGFLSDMICFFAKHYNRQVVLLIDEYDVPLEKAASHGYYDEMRFLIRGMLEILKPEGMPLINGLPILGKAVLAGCLRVSKESIFTGVNNFSVNTVCTDNDTFAPAIGFTESEVGALLLAYELDSRKDDVKRWYDGYRFGSSAIYCPWDVLNFCRFALESRSPVDFEPRNFWTGTGGSEAIDEFLGFLSEEDASRMQTLLDGGEIECTLNEQLTYADFAGHKSDDFWTLLLFTGYLTVSRQLGRDRFQLKIPNEEIRQTFRERIEVRFSSRNASFAQHGVKLADAALSGSADGMAEVLEPLLRKYVSVRDAASRAPAENYYHGFLCALLASAEARIQDFASNAEAGDGYADIVFTSGTGSRRVGVVLEVKRAKSVEDLRKAAQQALKQIEEKDYGSWFRKMRCAQYYAYGIAFCGKHCEVGGGTAAASD